MEQINYTLEQVGEAKNLLTILDSVPPEKRFVLQLMTEAFINGMNAQEQLSNSKACV